MNLIENVVTGKKSIHWRWGNSKIALQYLKLVLTFLFFPLSTEKEVKKAGDRKLVGGILTTRSFVKGAERVTGV